ncbi:MAG: PASTA domain-containing protein [Proteobacteria bacterium]|nr:PASTA domain-containing protein [Pseudomonadota bacterium]
MMVLNKFSRLFAVLFGVLVIVYHTPVLHAGCGAGWTYYGYVYLNDSPTPLSGDSGAEISVTNSGGEVLASYTLGSNPEAGDMYSFSIPHENSVGEGCPSLTAAKGEGILIYINDHPYVDNPVVLGDVMNVLELNLRFDAACLLPDVVGLAQDAAARAILDAGFQYAGEMLEECSNEFSAGHVIRQIPEPGEYECGQSITTYISTGPCPCMVPETSGCSDIEGAGLMCEVQAACSNEVAAGAVISIDPPVGTEVACGSTVVLTLSFGRPAAPDVIGKILANAQTDIQGAGLQVGNVTYEQSAIVAAGNVISQMPGAGPVNCGSAVDLVVSSGPCTEDVPELSDCTSLDGIDLVCQVVTQYSDTVPEGEVISQDPVPGTVVSCGSTITLIVSTGCQMTTVPDLAGLSEDEAKASVNNASLIYSESYEVTGSKKGYVFSQTPLPGTGICEAETVSFVVSLNNPPTANAGLDQPDVDLGDIHLDASGSTDVDEEALTYSWTIISPEGSTAILNNPTIVNPILTIDQYDTYVIQLQVCDVEEACDTDHVTISTEENVEPVADAGDDATVDQGDTVCLDGTKSSDPNGDSFTYSWTVTAPDGSNVPLDDPSSPTPCFTADQMGDYKATLVVSDGKLDSEPDGVTISSKNSKPIADAGETKAGPVNTVICLDGMGSSDPDGDDLSFSWAILSGPEGHTAELDDPTAVDPCLTPDLPGPYVAQLIVTDSRHLESEPDTVVIDAKEIPCVPPDGDLDGDCDVDMDDRNALLESFRKCEDTSGFNALADLDHDGCITGNDYRIWSSCYNNYVSGK